MLHRKPSGSSAEFWSENWRTQDFEEAVRGCEMHPLLPLFNRYLRPGVRFLEGGCGTAHFVAYFSRRDIDAIGVDFAVDTLISVRRLRPGLKLCGGDVTGLPFADASFDVYYSGGVVEHFEDGPGPALREAYRVVRPGGVFLVSVPYFSPTRKLLRAVKPRWKTVPHESETVGVSGVPRFFQYVYTPREFGERLAAAGFVVIGTQGYSILWGLYDIPWVERLVQAVTSSLGAKNSGDRTREQSSALSPAAESGRRVLLKRMLAVEDDTIPVAGLVVRGLRWALANMMMYVCVRPPQASSDADR